MNNYFQNLSFLHISKWSMLCKSEWVFYAVPTARVIFTAKTSSDVFSLRREQVWTFSVLGDRIYEMRCLYVAVGLNALFLVLPRWDNMSQAHTLPHPVTLYWHQADQLCFVVPTSSWVPCKQGPLPFFIVFGMTGPSTNQELNPQILLVCVGSPLSSLFTISRGYWGPFRHQGDPSGRQVKGTLDPHGVCYLRNW